MHQIFFDRIKKRLRQALPGAAAQHKMASSARNITLQTLPDANTRLSAVLILLYPLDGRMHVPLILRPVYKGVHSGQVSFPGGRFEEDDRSLINTALREAKEETGILPANVDVLGMLSPLYIPASNHMVYPVIGATTSRPDFKPDAYEVDKLLEVPLDELQDITRIGSKEIIIRDNIVIQAPFYDLQGQTVWGATAMIISEFLAVIQEAITMNNE